MKNLLKYALFCVLCFGISACNNATLNAITDSVKPSTQQKKARAASGYAEFTEAFMAKMPAVEEGFFGSVEVRFSENGDALSYKVKEFKGEFEANDWGRKGSGELYQKLVSSYLTSDISTNNLQFKAFMQVCSELGLKVKKYRNDLLSKTRISLPYYNQGNYDPTTKTSRSFDHNLDYIYLAFDKNGVIKVVFTYEHEFFYGNNGVKHEAMWALFWYGSAAVKAQQVFNNDLLDRYEVK